MTILYNLSISLQCDKNIVEITQIPIARQRAENIVERISNFLEQARVFLCAPLCMEVTGSLSRALYRAG